MTAPRRRVDLPATVAHGSLRAYNVFRCRRKPCTYRRQAYDREYWELVRGPIRNAQRRKKDNP